MEEKKELVEGELLAPKRKITLIPFGGLANRLKCICSSISLCLKYQIQLEIIWYMDEGLACPSHRLFTLKPELQNRGITIREASWKDHLLRDYPRRHNLWIPILPILFRYDFCLNVKTLKRWVDESPENIEELCRNQDWEYILIYACWQLYDDTNMYEHIEPTFEVLQACQALVAGWPDNMIGVHIRRTDHRISIEQSPTELFISAMQKMIEADSSVHFFIATDSLKERERIQTIFQGRVFAPFSTPSRDNAQGIISAFGEMLALSQTSQILATKDSTFSQEAARIGKIPYNVLSIYTTKLSNGIYDTRMSGLNSLKGE